MKIAILREEYGNRFDGDQYIVDLSRRFGGYESGDLICNCCPFNIPLELCFAIRKDGSMIFRSWSWTTKHRPNPYLHTHEKSSEFTPTQKQIDTVNGLFSNRLKFEGLEMYVGATVQDICQIDHEREEKLIGKKIYLANVWKGEGK